MKSKKYVEQRIKHLEAKLAILKDLKITQQVKEEVLQVNARIAELKWILEI